MDRRFTIALVLIFIALAAFAFYTQRDTEPVDMGAGTPTPTPEPLLELEASEVEEVGVVDATAGYTLTRVAGGWEVDGEPASDEVDGVVNGLASPTVLGAIPSDRNPEDYGFATPTLTVTLATAAGDAHVIVFGDQVPMSSEYYVRLAGEDRIVWISGYDIDRLKDWVDEPPLAPTPTPEVTETPEGAEAAEGDAEEMEADLSGDDEADEMDEASADEEEAEDALPSEEEEIDSTGEDEAGEAAPDADEAVDATQEPDVGDEDE